MEPMVRQLGLILSLVFSAACTKFSENDIPELEYLDTSVDPCDNFYDFVCGNFEKIHPRPDNVDSVDQFTLLEDNLVEIGYEILSSPTSEDDPTAVKKAKDAYRSCFSTSMYGRPELTTVNEFGGMPLLSSEEEEIDFSWNDVGELVAKYGVPLIFIFTVGQTSRDEAAIAIGPDTFANPILFRPRHRKSYDEVLEESFKEDVRRRVTRATEPQPFDIFLQTIAKNLLKASNLMKSDEEIAEDLNDMANFMRDMYAGGIVEDDVDILPLDTKITVGQLQNWTERQFSGELDLNWIDYLNRVFQLSGVTITQDVTLLLQQDARWFYGILNLVRQTDSKIVKNFALLRIFLFQAPDSDYPTRKAFEDYYNAKGYQLYPRWEYCTRKILDVVDTASLSYAVTYAYQQYHYNANKLVEAAELVRNIQNSFHDVLEANDWMDAASRDKALKKAENMLVLLGYPDFDNDKEELDQFYENLTVDATKNYANAQTIRAFKQAYQFTQLNLDRAFWGKSTFDPNAYYNRPNNKIVLPISMLNPVFFYGDNPILDYSRLGSIIGHEITHGFDVNGKNYDQDGVLNSWWTDDTMAAFTRRTTCFTEQYNQYYVPELQTYINGSYCINENLADNGGIRESYKAFRKIVQNQQIEVTGSYTLDQLFFIGYGTMWCSDDSVNALRLLVGTPNGYPPKRYRVTGALSNMEEFAEAFTCPVGSTMNPENKCVLW